MAEAAKLPVKNESQGQVSPAHRPLETLHREIDRLFTDFNRSWPLSGRPLKFGPLWDFDAGWGAAPAVDVVEKDKTYEITAELPGMDEKSIELNVSDDVLTIKGEKREEKEEKKKDFYLSERRYGAFERSFRIPENADADKINAAFKNGVLTVSIEKKPGSTKAEKKIAVKAA